MENGLKLLTLNRMFKNKTGSKGSGSSSKKPYSKNDELEIDKMVFSDDSSNEPMQDINDMMLDEFQLRTPKLDANQTKILVECLYQKEDIEMEGLDLGQQEERPRLFIQVNKLDRSTSHLQDQNGSSTEIINEQTQHDDSATF
jgi:hypothetical protein